MRYTLHIIADKTESKWFYRNGYFVLHESKMDKEFQPYFFDTHEAARSAATIFVSGNQSHNKVYLCDESGNEIEVIERK